MRQSGTNHEPASLEVPAFETDGNLLALLPREAVARIGRSAGKGTGRGARTDIKIIVVGENHAENNSFSLLRLGVKGLLTYMEAREQLIRALPLVANGGFWVPRQLLSGFVDSRLTSQGRRLKTDSVTNLSRREQEVLDSLLENLSNKEIASKLNIAERTVKFHVSNLLNKFGVRRRADLILLTFQRRLSQA